MSFYVLVQPDDDTTSALIEHVSGHPSLVLSCCGSQISVQVAARNDGLALAAKFGRSLEAAAEEFADRREALSGLKK